MRTSEYWIKKLNLQPHPEGGFFRETYRSEEIIPAEALPKRYTSPHSYSTQIHFMLVKGNHSSFHRLKSDETWHFYDGSPVTIWLVSDEYGLQEVTLGLDGDAQPQFTIPKGYWFAAEVKGDGEFSLVGCSVAPGFDFADFEMAKRESLYEKFPFETVKRLSQI
jgi:predicted cupin superfamily sugar epimerase